ncbi:hypothetical protein JCM6882_000957 [Rhodosporidiobolus microsporus]
MATPGHEFDDIVDGRASGVINAGAGGGGGGGGANLSNFDAEKAENDEADCLNPFIEMQFAVMCMEKAETHFKLITSMRASTLPRLTKWDASILSTFLTDFPDLANDVDKLRNLDEERDLKSPAMKKRWREFMMKFEKEIDEYNFGTLIRANCEDDYTQANSMFGYRLQFYAIEIQRNKLGLNDSVYEQVQKDPKRFD